MKKFIYFPTTVLAVIGFSFLFCSCKKDNSNTDPNITKVSVVPATVNAGGAILIGVTASDTDNDELTYKYDISGGAVTKYGSLAIWQAPPAAGSHNLTVTVSDGKGGEATKTQSIEILSSITEVCGVARFNSSPFGELNGAKVYLFKTIDDYANWKPFKSETITISGACAVFNIPVTEAGSCYLMVWKDTDSSGSATSGDFLGWVGDGEVRSPHLTPFQVENGKASFCNVIMVTAPSM